MKLLSLLITLSTLLFSCSSSPKCEAVEVLYPTEIFTLYQNDQDNFNLIKVFETPSNTIEVNYISIVPGKDLNPLQQTLIKTENYSIEEKDDFKKKHENDYPLKPQKENDVFWIQIQPTKEMLAEKKDFELSDEIEALINQELLDNNAGIFFAGHVGYGGLNMLCHYTNESVAIQSIFKILCQNGLTDYTLIAKRAYIQEDSWIHEVVYPKGYSGEFNLL